MITIKDLENAYPALIKKIRKKARGENDMSIIVEKGIYGTIFFSTITRDPETGEQIQRCENRSTYYSTGDLDIISQKEFDAANNLVLHQEIKHYTDGRQPTVNVIK